MKYRKNGDKYFLSLVRGDLINKSLTELAITEGISNAWINGIGAMENIHIGCFDLDTKGYLEDRFEGEYELSSLIGNITLNEGKPFVHTHITFTNREFKAFGGHLFDGKITATGEFIVMVDNEPIHRELNRNIGLSLWCLGAKASESN